MSNLENDYHALRGVLEAFAENLPAVDAAGERIVEALKSGGKILTCGNGGSAADALHLSEELLGRYDGDRPAKPAVCLCADAATLTCIGNDYGFEEIFARQVDALAQKVDVLIGFSTSGNSENVRRAFERAKAKGTTTILVSGRDGGAIKESADQSILVPSDSTARIQEIHTFVLHAWLERVERAFQQ